MFYVVPKQTPFTEIFSNILACGEDFNAMKAVAERLNSETKKNFDIVSIVNVWTTRDNQ